MATLRRRWLAGAMTLRVLWGLCLAVAAMVTGIGVELALSGAGPLVSYPLVVGGIVMLPLASSALERIELVRAGPPR
jgi:hypothetical protein